jgi:hypothetical protein
MAVFVKQEMIAVYVPWVGWNLSPSMKLVPKETLFPTCLKPEMSSLPPTMPFGFEMCAYVHLDVGPTTTSTKATRTVLPEYVTFGAAANAETAVSAAMRTTMESERPSRKERPLLLNSFDLELV